MSGSSNNLSLAKTASGHAPPANRRVSFLSMRLAGMPCRLVTEFARRPRRNRSPLLDSQQPDECHTPVSPGRTALAPAPVPAPPAPPPVVQETAPSPPAAPALPTTQEAAVPPEPGPSPTPPPAPSPTPDAGQQAAAAPAPPAAPSPTPVTPCSPAALRDPLTGRRSAPAAARARTGGVGSPGRICAQEPRAAGRDLGLFRGGLRAAISAARRRLGLSPADGQVRPGRDRRVDEEDPSAFRHLPDRGRV